MMATTTATACSACLGITSKTILIGFSVTVDVSHVFKDADHLEKNGGETVKLIYLISEQIGKQSYKHTASIIVQILTKNPSLCERCPVQGIIPGFNLILLYLKCQCLT